MIDWGGTMRLAAVLSLRSAFRLRLFRQFIRHFCLREQDDPLRLPKKNTAIFASLRSG
jgi:hypothetical protein